MCAPPPRGLRIGACCSCLKWTLHKVRLCFAQSDELGGGACLPAASMAIEEDTGFISEDRMTGALQPDACSVLPVRGSGRGEEVNPSVAVERSTMPATMGRIMLWSSDPLEIHILLVWFPVLSLLYVVRSIVRSTTWRAGFSSPALINVLRGNGWCVVTDQ